MDSGKSENMLCTYKTFYVLFLSKTQSLEKLTGEEKYFIKVRCKEDGNTEYAPFGDDANFNANQITKVETKYRYDENHNYGTDITENVENSNLYPCEQRSLRIFIGNGQQSKCKQTSYAVGYKLGDKVIILMELCYNAIDKHLDFVHYIQSQKAHSISELYNPVNASGPSSNQSSLPAADYLER